VVRGTVHKACSCLLLSESQQAAVRFLGQPLRADDHMLAGAGAALDLFVPNGAVLHVLVVEALEGISRRALRICADATARNLASLRQYIRYPDQHRNNIDASLVNHLRQIVTTSNSMPLRHNTLRVSAVVFACQLVERRFPKPTTLSVLSRHCGVAERTLEYGFRQMYDTTPMAYIRSQRLTRNRMALLRAPAHASISQTARAFGFTHMGQYSRDYRLLFGETPSMTRARANG
jgi:transcriptional regulator GlxA family with amidase domain